MDFKEISDITSGRIYGPAPERISGIFTDSRSIPVVPSDALFVALSGPRHNGHRFIPELITAGVRLFLVNHIPQNIPKNENLCFLVVEDTLHALQRIAAFHRSQFNFPVIGITGSNGKTIVKEWLYQLLQSRYQIVRSPKSYNSQVGVPLSLLLLKPEYNLALVEAGISRYGEMALLEEMIRPDIGIFTNIGEAHQENFQNIQTKIREKLGLFKRCPVLIYCRDQELLHKEVLEYFNGGGPLLLTWSQKSTADLRILTTNNSTSSRTVSFEWKGQRSELEVPFTDQASFENSMHCLLTCLHLGIGIDQVQEMFARLTPVAMRMELKNGINGCTIINDSYSADLVSLTIALDFLQRQSQNPVKTLILSDILESGKKPEALYKEVAVLIAAKGVNRFIGIGPALQSYPHLFPAGSLFFGSTKDFLMASAALNFRDEAILLKGARTFAFEQISDLLEQKKHQTRLEINLQAMVHNLNYFRSLLHPGTRIMVMVKALSYGSGTYEIASLLQYHKVDYLAVAVADEGIALRRGGIQTPILVMNPEAFAFEAMIRYRLEPELYSLPLLREFIQWAASAGIQEYPVHLKLDTGMHRLGFEKKDLSVLLELLAGNQLVKVKSLFSHLAGSEDPLLDSFSREQFTRFREMSKLISDHLGYPVMRHILNSAGIERFPEEQMEMVRLGIGLYGVSTVNQSGLQQIGTLRSIISQLRQIDAGETVGYNRKGLVVEKTRVAVVPIGYADGLNRKLGNGKGYFLVHGKKAPIIGNICMDMCMININGIEAQEGDEVIIFGEDLPVTRVASILETIPYEVLTGISSRVKRIYFQD